MITPTNLPICDLGKKSPYPTVDMVTITFQKELEYEKSCEDGSFRGCSNTLNKKPPIPILAIIDVHCAVKGLSFIRHLVAKK